MLTKFLIVLIVSHKGALLGLESANNNNNNSTSMHHLLCQALV